MHPHPTQESLRDRLGQPGQAAQFKAISQLDVHCKNILALSPFAVVATASANGSCDASPRGGPPGFIRVLSPTRVAIGELPGNRLFDGAQNLAENPSAALLVMIPGVNETLRIEGRAAMSTDEDIRAATSLDGKVPWGALVIDIVKIFTHCGKALKRSRLWEPASWPPPDQRPRMGAKTFSDVISGAKASRPGLDKALEQLRDGDTLVVWKLDRLGRSVKNLIAFTEQLHEAGIGFRSLTDQIDTTTPAGRFFFHVMASLAQMERELTTERTRAGLEAARKNGRPPGRKRIMTDRKITAAKQLLDQGTSAADVAHNIGVSIPTLYRWIPATDR